LGVVGDTVLVSIFFEGVLCPVSFKLRPSCGARLGMGYAEAAG
jgi:hypothetical protein